MVGRISTTLRPLPRRLRYQASYTQAECIILSGDDRAKRRRVIRRLSVLAQSLAQRLKHDRFQRQLDTSALRRGLHHKDNEQVVLGIDTIEAAARAVPAVFTQRPCRVRRRRGAHSKAKTEAATRARKIEGAVNDPGLRA